MRSASPPSPPRGIIIIFFFISHPPSPRLHPPPAPLFSRRARFLGGHVSTGRRRRDERAPGLGAGRSAGAEPRFGPSVLRRIDLFKLLFFLIFFSSYISLSPGHRFQLKTTKFFSSAILISFHSAPLGEEVMLPDYPASPPDG